MVTAYNRARRARIAYWITLALVALAVGTLLLLLPLAGSGRTWAFDWLPGAGPMAIGLGETGVYAALVTVGACLLSLAMAQAKLRPAGAALVLLALLGGACAFLAEHFLLRYAALEIVALCVALAPLVEGVGGEDQADRGRWVRLVYLLLRVGDAGLLAGILALWGATSTLDIAPALTAGGALPVAARNWIAAGFLLAVWVKVGGWPLHVWQQAGTRLSLFSRTWLYRTLTPNLGLYLLYRVTPLLAGAPIARAFVLWGGALGAACAALLALGAWLADGDRALARRLDGALLYANAVQAGLALLLAAMGLKSAVWLVLILLTPLRLLLALAGRTAQEAARASVRRLAALLYGLSGLLLLVLQAWIVWGTREAGLPLFARLLAEGAVGLSGAWVLLAATALWREAPAGQGEPRAAVRRDVVLALLAASLLVSGLLPARLLGHLTRVSNGPPFELPAPAQALRFLATSPAALLALVLALWGARARVPIPAPLARWMRGRDLALALERSIRRGARALRARVEAGAFEGALTGIARGVLGAARLAHRWIEGVVLEGTTRQIAHTATESGRLAYRVMEQGGLEGLLRRAVQAVLASSRWLQRRHTGRLRLNLIWVAISLALAILALILFAW